MRTMLAHARDRQTQRIPAGVLMIRRFDVASEFVDGAVFSTTTDPKLKSSRMLPS